MQYFSISKITSLLLASLDKSCEDSAFLFRRSSHADDRAEQLLFEIIHSTLHTRRAYMLDVLRVDPRARKDSRFVRGRAKSLVDHAHAETRGGTKYRVHVCARTRGRPTFFAHSRRSGDDDSYSFRGSGRERRHSAASACVISKDGRAIVDASGSFQLIRTTNHRYFY